MAVKESAVYQGVKIIAPEDEPSLMRRFIYHFKGKVNPSQPGEVPDIESAISDIDLEAYNSVNGKFGTTYTPKKVSLSLDMK
ncbi:MAG: hypothetical protein GOU98_02370 [Candidatus Altiarchaeota archaeon]|nr:hypothetical protein [Candidatus Altiarchaeota archaeon]